jgi:transmembrane sensor
MIPDDDLTCIASYLVGEGSAAERAETERWIAADAERRDMVESLRQAWTKAGRDEAPVNIDRAWEQLQRRRAARDVSHDAPVRPLTSGDSVPGPGEVSQPAASTTPSGREPRRRVIQLIPRRMSWTRAPLLRVAAVVVAVAGAGALTARIAVRAPAVKSPAPATREIATARGQRATITLSDGSRVALGVASKLRFAEGFGGARRDVYLEGEAVFEVQHDSLRPFVVRTARAIATDLGTTFVVRDYDTDSSVTVAVREGVVELRAAGLPQLSSEVRAVTLEAGEFGRVDHLGNLASRRGNIDDFFAWAEGRLAFRNAPLAEVAAQLERWYDVDIELGSGTQKRTINATFGDDGIETTLDLIANATDVRVVRRGNIYMLTISPERQ